MAAGFSEPPAWGDAHNEPGFVFSSPLAAQQKEVCIITDKDMHAVRSSTAQLHR